jgi:N-acetylglucosamine kinase-like BadF-type ATPase
MILIADSGSTKTKWRVIKNANEWIDFTCEGINPYFHSTEDILTIIRNQCFKLLEDFSISIREIHYYGTGCSTKNNIETVKSALSNLFKNAVVEVQHDLLAAARALCGKQSGIACILGTGSNSCLYNGRAIEENVTSFGYLFGDHGSGAHIGKTFVQAYFNRELPQNIKNNFEEQGYNLESILTHVYKQPMPNRYLASITRFIKTQNDSDFIRKLLVNSFNQFFRHQVLTYTNAKLLPVHFTGSIASNFKEELTEAAKINYLQLGNIIQEPIGGLTHFHRNG